MTGNPLPHLDESPELLALLDELVTARNLQADFWWNKYVGEEISDVHLKETSSRIETITLKIVEKPFEPVRTYYRLYLATKERDVTENEVKIANYRNEGFICKDVTFNDRLVTWNSWFPWLRSSAEPAAADRKKVFDTFLSQVPAFKELLVERFILFKNQLEELGVDIKEYTSIINGLSFDVLKNYIERLLDKLKPFLPGLYSEMTGKFFGQQSGYYDNPFLLIYPAYREVERECPEFKSFDRVIAFCREMGYDFTRLAFDTEMRGKKHPLPFCSPVSIPDDIRVSIYGVKGFRAFVGLMHELGHAFYFSSIDPGIPAYRRYFGEEHLYTEVPSMLIGDYLTKREDVRAMFLGKVSSDFAGALNYLNRVHLLWRASTAILTLAKHTFYEQGSVDAVTEEYQRLLDRHFDSPLDARFWYLAPLAQYVVTFEIYIYSMGTALGLVNSLAAVYGDDWWIKPAAHSKLRSIWSKGPAFTKGLPEADPETHARWLLANAGLDE